MKASVEFSGGVFSDQLEGGRAAARVAVSGGTLTARTVAGEDFSLALSECAIERGGASGRMWFCKHPEHGLTVFCEEAGFGQALLEQGPRRVAEQVQQVLSQARARGRRRLSLWLLSLIGAGVLCWLGAAALRSVGRASASALPIAVDEKLGELAREHMDLHGTEVTDEAVRGAVEALAAPLTQGLEQPFTFRFLVVEAPIMNAFALPGGTVVVYTELLREAESPQQVQGVLAHEIAHVTRRHGVQRIAQSVGVVAAVQLLFGDVSGLFAVAVEVLREGAINRYSREQEHEADMDAVHTLAGAGVDPEALASFFERLAQREGSLALPAWLSTHPDTKERVREIERERERFLPIETRPVDVDWAALSRRVSGAKALSSE